jgi:hypothetical protein
MQTKDDGGPAFPLPSEQAANGRGYRPMHGGMSLRDYFAAKAMNGLVAADAVSRFAHQYSVTAEKAAAAVTKSAYTMADAMLEARKR